MGSYGRSWSETKRSQIHYSPVTILESHGPPTQLYGSGGRQNGGDRWPKKVGWGLAGLSPSAKPRLGKNGGAHPQRDGVRRLEGEIPQKHGQQDAGLQDGELVAHTLPAPAAEGDEAEVGGVLVGVQTPDLEKGAVDQWGLRRFLNGGGSALRSSGCRLTL